MGAETGAICVARSFRDLLIIVLIVNSICTSIVLCFNHPLQQIFLILCTPIRSSSFKIITTKSILIASGVKNQYLVHFTTVQIARILNCLFNLHKECAELPLEINHPYDRKHPLALFATTTYSSPEM
ncbi:hypothetical protein ES332_A02G032800v1 [Gossypium tomentosum]|uniref:Uncharacterized protein n=1 Tax=Gossypium tomentosum TaxID=34277 RepID=A0A5D2RCF8_GOSTO|nr:hypothetical protein ES332_A02G032800v1 [Gossypium tomentosum]